VPSGRLNLYRFIEDAWSGGLRAWCDAGVDDSAMESWVLLENAGQGRWLRRRLAEVGIGGIRMFDAEGLRDELARLAGVEVLRRNGAAEFAVKVAVGQGDEHAARSAGAVAEACDALARAGWHPGQLQMDGEVARRINRTLERAPVIAGIFDRRLREQLAPQRARLCCVGWDATHWPDIGLLHVAAEKTAALEMFVPSPRLPADGLQREWIEALEGRFGLERVTCPESGFASANEALVARLENSQLAGRGEVAPPTLLVGREWVDQVGLVCGQVREWLAENPVDPIGVIAPEDSASAIAVAEELLKSGVQVEHRARIPELGGAERIIEQVVRYHIEARDIGEFLELAQLLWIEAPQLWKNLEPGNVRDLLDQAFRAAQSRNTRILARALPRCKDAAWSAIRELVEGLGRWDTEIPWGAVRERWKSLLGALRLQPDALGAEWARMFNQERVQGRAFMEWIAARMAARRQEVAATETGIAAPVVVTTFDAAGQQTWHRVIFLDSNEHAWPAAVAENPFLLDAARVRLNANRRESGLLLTTRDLRALEQARFLDLLEHCREPVAFAGVLIHDAGTGEAAQPNEWVLRAMLESGEDAWSPDFWSARAQTVPGDPQPALDVEEAAHLVRVHANRRNGVMPFDRYHFDFHETKLMPGAWSATDLDKAITCPATFALKTLLDAESTVGWSPVRQEGTVVGTYAHRWLGRALGLSDQLAPPAAVEAAEGRLLRELAAMRAELEEWFGAEGMTVPLWWESTVRKTAWAARRCIREAREWIDGRLCAVEQKLAVNIGTASGPLLLKGRIDILISDQPGIRGANVHLFDFKTGRASKAPTLTTLAQGSGGQFAAYYLMARDAGAVSAVIGIIKPEETARAVFGPGDEVELRARMGVLAELQRDLRFGQAPAKNPDYGPCETLPLATVPIDPAILTQKAELVLYAQ